MKKSAITKMPQYFDRYINLVEDMEVTEALEKYGYALFEKDLAKLEKLGDKAYAHDKWTIKDILQHLIDAERVFAYRATRFARRDKTPLPGFDENDFAVHTQAKKRAVSGLLEEFRLLRASNIMFYRSLDEEALMQEGVASGDSISVLALGFTMAGHPVHHMNVIKERYYPLLG